MRTEKKFALHYISINELETIEKVLLNLGCDSCEYEFTLEFEDERIQVTSKEELTSISKIKNSNPQSFNFRIMGKKFLKEANYTTTIYRIDLVAHPVYERVLSVAIDTPEAEKTYLILSKLEQILDLKKAEYKSNAKNKKIKSVFIAHSFDEQGRVYGQILGKFLTLLGFDVKSGEKYSPEPVDIKIKKRAASQEILMTVYSPKLDYTWLHQETGGCVFADKPIFILKEDGVKIEEGILRGREYILFPSGNIEKTFIAVIEGLDEIDYL
ncbi:MAG: hypothetical protein WC312_06735 [Candidatus Omnitrophota bacterium]|jgi:hypothetical protein